MVHLISHKRPICECHNLPCEFPTRSMAFDAMQRLTLKEVEIAIGRCPHFHNKETQS